MGDGRIAVMRRKFAASGRRKRLKTSQRHGARQDSDDLRGRTCLLEDLTLLEDLRFPRQEGLLRSPQERIKDSTCLLEDCLNTPSEDERAQTYFDDMDREVLGPDYKRILEVHYSLCGRG